MMLMNKGNGKFATEKINALTIKGQVRHIKSIQINKQPSFILAKNNDTTQIIQFKKPGTLK